MTLYGGPQPAPSTPVERARASRRANATRLGRFHRRQSLFISGFIGVLGLALTVGALVSFTPTRLAGALMVLASPLLMLRGDRNRVETIEPEDTPAHVRELLWWAGAFVLVLAGAWVGHLG